MTNKPTCLHCSQKCELTTGEEIYPEHPHLHHKYFWKCDPCYAYVGCHKGGKKPLGHAANSEVRRARRLLHLKTLDPLWKKSPINPHPKYARWQVYRYLSNKMCLRPENTHTGMFDLDQCREAWKHLRVIEKEFPPKVAKQRLRDQKRKKRSLYKQGKKLFNGG